jgi:ankyrin repeat protein
VASAPADGLGLPRQGTGLQTDKASAGEYGKTAFQAAAENDNLELCRILLNAGADVNATPADKDGRTLLQAAAENDNLKLCRILLNAGADVNAGGYRRTALQVAAGNDNLICPVLEYRS